MLYQLGEIFNLLYRYSWWTNVAQRRPNFLPPPPHSALRVHEQRVRRPPTWLGHIIQRQEILIYTVRC